jgi:hypothetical protein
MASRAPGFSARVFLVNLFGVLTRPKCVYDTFEELASDGWVVD